MGDIRYEGLPFLSFRQCLSAVFLQDLIQPGKPVSDTGKLCFTVFRVIWRFVPVYHMVEGLAPIGGKQCQPFSKGQRQHKEPDKGAEYQYCA